MEPLLPEVEAGVQCTSPQHVPLPDGVIGVLERQLFERRGAPGAVSPVQGGQLPGQDARRPAVERDVMHGDRQDVRLLVEPQQLRAHERTAREIDRPPRHLRGEARRGFVPALLRQVPQIDHGQRRHQHLRDDLDRRALRHGEDGAHRFVAPRDLVEGPDHRLYIQPSLQAHGAGGDEAAALRHELIRQPHALLHQ
jgi:hypothetical protein